MITATPDITIYVRHSAGCKHAADETYKRCQCRKWLRWTQGKVRKRISAETRSWSDAEQVKRDIADTLSGKVAPIAVEAPIAGKSLNEASTAFIAEKQVEKLSPDVISKYRLWLGRLIGHLGGLGVTTLDGVNREHLVAFVAGWETTYPSSLTRSKLKERYKSFFTFCVSSGWLAKAPEWPKIKSVEQAPTLPLTEDEFARLLDAVGKTVKAPIGGKSEKRSHAYWQARVRGLFLLMRWSGLSIMDALTLERSAITVSGEAYRVRTARTKTGTDVSVVVPAAVATEILSVPNDNPLYLFWSGKGEKKSICGNWGKRFIAPAFKHAGLDDGGYMKAHRLRDTFACDLLSKGVPLEDVSRLLGHTSVRTTEKHYSAHVASRQDRLDDLVKATWK